MEIIINLQGTFFVLLLTTYVLAHVFTDHNSEKVEFYRGLAFMVFFTGSVITTLIRIWL